MHNIHIMRRKLATNGCIRAEEELPLIAFRPTANHSALWLLTCIFANRSIVWVSTSRVTGVLMRLRIFFGITAPLLLVALVSSPEARADGLTFFGNGGAGSVFVGEGGPGEPASGGTFSAIPT